MRLTSHGFFSLEYLPEHSYQSEAYALCSTRAIGMRHKPPGGYALPITSPGLVPSARRSTPGARGLSRSDPGPAAGAEGFTYRGICEELGTYQGTAPFTEA